jgi:hypothetical protein
MSEAQDVAAGQLVEISAWIDEHNEAETDTARLLGRVIKAGKENGEMVAEVIGMIGQNPRKGVTSDAAHVEKEAFDLALTALGIVEHLRGNDGAALAGLCEHIEFVHGRMLGAPSTDAVASDVKIDKALESL